jgi:hypothetical protein
MVYNEVSWPCGQEAAKAVRQRNAPHANAQPTQRAVFAPPASHKTIGKGNASSAVQKVRNRQAENNIIPFFFAN